MGHAPVTLDVARLLNEHPLAVPAAAGMRLEEMNQLPDHRRLMLAVLRVEPLEDVDRPGVEVEESQDLEKRLRRIASLHLLAEIELEIRLGHRDHVGQRVRYGMARVGRDPRQERDHQRFH